MLLKPSPKANKICHKNVIKHGHIYKSTKDKFNLKTAAIATVFYFLKYIIIDVNCILQIIYSYKKT